VRKVEVGVRKIANGQPPNGKPKAERKKYRKTKNTGKIEVLVGNKAIDTKLAPKKKQKNNTKRNKNKKEENRKKKITRNYTYKTKIETKNATIRYF
jgi:hypothetical protein